MSRLTLKQTQLMRGATEYITMTDLRTAPGDIIDQVQMGKAFVISKSGKPVAVLQKLPGDTLSIVVDAYGHETYAQIDGPPTTGGAA